MDYAEHEKTYAGFIRFSILASIWCLTIVIGMAIGGPAKSWGTGGFLVFLSTVATLVGIFVKSIDYKASLAVFLLAMVVWAAKALH